MVIEMCGGGGGVEGKIQITLTKCVDQYLVRARCIHNLKVVSG